MVQSVCSSLVKWRSITGIDAELDGCQERRSVGLRLTFGLDRLGLDRDHRPQRRARPVEHLPDRCQREVCALLCGNGVQPFQRTRAEDATSAFAAQRPDQSPRFIKA
ncbi:hypothetical protein ABDZ99_12055 (plasmid) [Sphingomonas parapaucimobilis]